MFYWNVRATAVAALVGSVVVSGVGSVRAQTDMRSAVVDLAKQVHTDVDVQKLKGQRIVIAEFENINGKGDAVPRILQEMFTTEFIKQKHFKVVERAQLTKALAELKLGLSDLYDSDKVKRLGKLVGASYLFIGSISDIGSGTNVSGRIVSLEDAESVRAADVIIKGQDIAPPNGTRTQSLSVEETSLSPERSNPLSPAPTGTGASISLDSKANVKVAGKWNVSPRDFGLLGGTNFVVEWNESLPVKGATGFTVGDIYGDGTRSLITFTQGETAPDQRQTYLQVWQWSSGKFKELWRSSDFGYNYLYIHQMNRPPFMSIVNVGTRPTLMVGWEGRFRPTDRLSETTGFYWDGTSFQKTDRVSQGRLCGILSQQPCKILTQGSVDRYLDLNVETLSSQEGGLLRPENSRSLPFSQYSGAVVCIPSNVDTDSATEIAMLDREDGMITIRRMDFTEKASLFGFQKSKFLPSNLILRTWNVGNNPTPYIVLTENVMGDSPDAGGYFQLVQFNGRSYERVWSSRRFGDEIVDIQVGALKGESRPSLLVLSRTKDRYELTKVAPQ